MPTSPIFSRRPLLGLHHAARLLVVALTLAATVSSLRAQSDEPDGANPTGPTGDFNGEITTGDSYDPFTGNAKRAVTDLVVPGAAGAYGLAFARVSNSRPTSTDPQYDSFFGDGANWRHSYQ